MKSVFEIDKIKFTLILSHNGLGHFEQLNCFKVTDTWFVCVEVLRPSQPNGVMLSAVSLPNHTFTGQA